VGQVGKLTGYKRWRGRERNKKIGVANQSLVWGNEGSAQMDHWKLEALIRITAPSISQNVYHHINLKTYITLLVLPIG
jgi:hypothetical protein